MKSARDIVLQFLGQLIVGVLVNKGVIPQAMQVEAQLAAIAVMPPFYRGLRAMKNPVGEFIRSMDDPGSAPN